MNIQITVNGYPTFIAHIVRAPTDLFITKDAKIPSARSPWRLNLVRWHLIFVGTRYGTCFTSSFSRLELWDGFYIFCKSVHPCPLQ